MEKSMFFNSVQRDRVYKAEDFALYFDSFIGNGVFPSDTNGLKVTSNQDMSVSVNKGKGWINGYMYYNTSNYVVKVDNASGVLSRIDRIVLRLNLTKREIRVDILKGSEASHPSPPELTRNSDIYELCLANIRINSGAVSISEGNITDTRGNKDVCGFVSGTITGASEIGDLHELKTNSKDNLVNAINEVFTDVDNGKRNIYGAIVDKGVSPSSQDFDELASSIRKIPSGSTCTGNAQALDVLDGKTFCNSKGTFTGIMPNRGDLSIKASKMIESYPSGYYSSVMTEAIDGKSIARLYPNFKAENIRKNTNIAGVIGTLEEGNPVLVPYKESMSEESWEFYTDEDATGLLFLVSASISCRYNGRKYYAMFMYEDISSPSYSNVVSFSTDDSKIEIVPDSAGTLTLENKTGGTLEKVTGYVTFFQA